MKPHHIPCSELCGDRPRRLRPTASFLLSVLFLLSTLILPSGLIPLSLTVRAAQADPVRIMPLGDSITQGKNGYASYRYWLWKDLEIAGFSVDFVGSQYGVYQGDPPYDDYDQDHEGHWGWRADEIRELIGGWCREYQPEAVLLHLGHNDLYQGQSIQSTVEDLGGIVDSLRSGNPHVTVFLAQIIPSGGGFGSINLLKIGEFNSYLPGLALSKSTPDSPVLVVDQFTGFDPVVDTDDGLHPNESGEIKMAGRWFEPLSYWLSEPASVEDGAGPEGGGADSGESEDDRDSSGPEDANGRSDRSGDGSGHLSEMTFSAGPNPTHGPLTLRFRLPDSGRVRIAVFDPQGRRLGVLADGLFGPGHQQLSVDLRDHVGNSSGGAVFLRLETIWGETSSRVLMVP